MGGGGSFKAKGYVCIVYIVCLKRLRWHITSKYCTTLRASNFVITTLFYMLIPESLLAANTRCGIISLFILSLTEVVA